LPVPLFVAQGEVDEIVDPEVTEEYVKHQCDAGGDVELKRYPDTGHFAVRTKSAGDVATWLFARFAGAPTSPTCPAATS
jgi:predicted esterase